MHYQRHEASGRGQISVRLDGGTHVLKPSETSKAEAAAFDRFDLFNVQSGGHAVELYLDDIYYTRPEKMVQSKRSRSSALSRSAPSRSCRYLRGVAKDPPANAEPTPGVC